MAASVGRRSTATNATAGDEPATNSLSGRTGVPLKSESVTGIDQSKAQRLPVFGYAIRYMVSVLAPCLPVGLLTEGRPCNVLSV
jgi:hypothetical protein